MAEELTESPAAPAEPEAVTDPEAVTEAGAPGEPEAVTEPTSSVGGGPADAAGGPEGRPNRRKVREGVVVSDSMDATVVVAIIERVRHPRYRKTVQRTKRLYAHDGEGAAKVGDRVRVVETRPLSKLKRWRVAEIVERAR